MSTDLATVTVILGSTPYTLRPTIDRMRLVNRLAGGLTPLFRAVGNLDGDTMALVIAAGAGVRGKPVEDLTRAVWESGLEGLVDPITEFLNLCATGGRAPTTKVGAVTASGSGEEQQGGRPGSGKADVRTSGESIAA